VDVVLREHEVAVCQHVELSRAPCGDRRVEPLLGQLGRETRGPAVVAASDGAIEDLDNHHRQRRRSVGRRASSAEKYREAGMYARSSPTAYFGQIRGGSKVRIKLSDADQLQRLLGFLAFDANVVVSQIGRDEVELSFLGSLNTSAQMMQSELRLRMWLAAHPDVIAVMQE
jgi:hypothetical protein